MLEAEAENEANFKETEQNIIFHSEEHYVVKHCPVVDV